MFRCKNAVVHMWKSRELVLSFHLVGLGVKTEVVRLGSNKHLYPLSYLASPKTVKFPSGRAFTQASQSTAPSFYG